MASRWARLAVKAHTEGAIRYDKDCGPRGWNLKEACIFDVLESEVLSKMHEMLHTEHVVLAGVVDPDSFRDEVDGARARYNSCGRLLVPWEKWAPPKTAVQAYNEAQERRKDPTHLARLKELQADLDAEGKRMADAVELEKQIRKEAAEHDAKSKLRARQRRRRHDRVSRGRAKSLKR